jgi:hypothetical protein
MAPSNELPTRVLETVAAVTQWLHANHVEGAIIGGVAVSLQAEPRFTADVDVRSQRPK